MIELSSKLLGLPVLASENGRAVDDLIIYIHWLMAVLFVGWLIYFLYCLWRFHARRNAQADHVGVRSHASNYIELAVAGIEAVLLVAFAIPMWARASDVTKIPASENAVQIQIMGQQFAWNARYPGKDGKFGKQSMDQISADNIFGVAKEDEAGKDDLQVLNEIHVPVNRPVICYVSSKDVIHSFKVIALRVTQDAIPGLRIPCWFKATKEGRYQINCAQLCGNGHSAMAAGFIVVESEQAYADWLAAQKPAGGAPASYD